MGAEAHVDVVKLLDEKDSIIRRLTFIIEQQNETIKNLMNPERSEKVWLRKRKGNPSKVKKSE